MVQDLASGAYLVIEKGPLLGKRVEIWKDSTTIGRRRECDIFLEDLAVSRVHATLRELPDGEYELVDNQSATGTFVNGQPIQRYLLCEGDIVQIEPVDSPFATPTPSPTRRTVGA